MGTRLSVLLWVLLGILCSWSASADTGKDVIGEIRTDLLFATNEDLSRLGMEGQALGAAEEKKLRALQALKFEHYRRLGSQTKPVWRAFENWAMPMAPSEEVMVSFEPKGAMGEDGLLLDLKLWIQKKEVLAAIPKLRQGRRLYILGPKWRGGNLIIAIELVESAQSP